MAKKKKNNIIDIKYMNEKGFSDGYSGIKNETNKLIDLLTKKKIKSESIVELISTYNNAYTRGSLANSHLNQLKIIDGVLTINEIPVPIFNKINEDEIMEQVLIKRKEIKKGR